MLIKIKNVVELSTKTGSKYFSVEDSDGARYSVWDMKLLPKFVEGLEIDLATMGLRVKEKTVAGKQYLNIEEASEQYAKPRFSKSEDIDKALDKKSRNVSMAQDRNERMWAKYGACEIVAHHPAYAKYDITEVGAMISFLTKFIYGLNMSEEVAEDKDYKEPKIHGDE